MTFVSSLGNWGWAWHIPLRKDTSVGLVVPVEVTRKTAPRSRGNNLFSNPAGRPEIWQSCWKARICRKAACG